MTTNTQVGCSRLSPEKPPAQPMNASALTTMVWWGGFALQACIASALLGRRLYRQFPIFFTYLSGSAPRRSGRKSTDLHISDKPTNRIRGVRNRAFSWDDSTRLLSVLDDNEYPMQPVASYLEVNHAYAIASHVQHVKLPIKQSQR